MKTLDEIALSDRDRTVIKDVSGILRSRFPATQIQLYGSKARDDDDGESDIDLLVLTERPMNMKERGDMIRMLTLTGEDWNRGVYQVLPIREEIDRDGITI